MTRAPLLGFLISALAAVACSDSYGTNPNTNPNIHGTFYAVVNGSMVFTPNHTLNATHNASNQVVIAAVHRTSNFSRRFDIALPNVIGPGTYTISAANTGSRATYSESNLVLFSDESWQAGPNGGSGELTISTLTSTRVVGSFTFTAPSSSGTTGAISVTEGEFDIVLTVPM
jgi:hypothetical protein